MAGDSRALPQSGQAGAAGAAQARRWRLAELQALDAVGQALASSLELGPCLSRGLQALLEQSPCLAAAILLPCWPSRELEVYTARREGEGIQASFRRLDLLALSEAPAIVWPPERPQASLAPPAIRGVETAPLRAGGLALGVLAVVPSPTSPAPRRLLAALGERFGQAVANARLFEGVRAEADQLAAINSVGDIARRPLPTRELLGQAVRRVLAVTNLDLAALYLRESGGDGLAVAACAGLTRSRAAGLIPRLPPRAAARGAAPKPVVEEAIGDTSAGRRKPRCLMHVPLLSPGRDLGVLTVGSYHHDHFAPGAAWLLIAMASHIALGLDYALLYREARERAAELARANEAMKAALHSKDQFLANVTHELRRPLAPARLVVETLLETPEGKLSPQRRERLLRNALANLDSLNALISELLDAARMERSPAPLERQLVDLAALARQSIASIRPLAEERSLRVQAILPPASVYVYGDAQALERVVGNLLSNAVKFNKARGSVLVQLERSGGQAVLSVTDTGIGIPAHAQPHIFERFYQADASSTRAHEGMGLGLYIAREIVRQLGGQIRFDTREGVGTTFTVTLPLA